ncbi:tRNA guanosine(34) transglycosylase Tgt [Candidatus Daviesbacteria bacterium]|nr:tRNA guanosine(34) transglycosylase Tgt [Candidatus Daviesbacteria bacterium]
MNRFKILHKDKSSRVGILKTAHGEIETPNFIPVGTQASVKAVSPRDLKELGAQVVLANTYHLMLRPGANLIEEMGGLHKFMGWNGPVMTDSGGFQVFSLGLALEHGVGKFLQNEFTKSKPRLNKVTEEGVIFQSHIDGSKYTLDAEKSIDLQVKLGADLIVAFDDLESPLHSFDETLKSLELTERWEQRSLKAFKKYAKAGQLLYGVTHGGVFEDLRIRSAKFVDKHFDAIALGGAHEDRKTLYKVVEWTVGSISEEKPRHLLGIGEVEDLFNCVERGIDLFDCAAPTRRARNGSLYVSPGSGDYSSLKGYQAKNYTINIKTSKFSKDKNPIDKNCKCLCCTNFTRAYLHHLYSTGEILYHELASIHNLFFVIDLMKKIRESIGNNRFDTLKNSWISF